MTGTEPLFPEALRLSTIAAALRGTQPLWAGLGVVRVRVFGSVARGEATPASDIDLLVDFDPALSRGLLDLMRAREVFEAALGRRVDVVTPGALRPPCAARFWPTRWTSCRCPTPRPAATAPNAGAGGCTTCWAPLTGWPSTPPGIP
ncbi:nucleotidyltransferase family protein [Deinococcus multiflagellatus]|uniref:Nucleotidyltransferase family protein n=1 Tax=Deinococcus multiflagellatus TaxID=1656887 RepID=A0ABW1ZPP4_9DEIO